MRCLPDSALFDQPPRAFGDEKHNEADANRWDALGSDGKTPGNRARGEAETEDEKVGDCNS